MKHLFSFLLASVLSVSLLFAIFCLTLSFDEKAKLRAGYCSAHGLVSIALTLPEECALIGDAAHVLKEALPNSLLLPADLFFSETVGLLSSMRAAYDKETAGCTATP